MKKPLLVGSAVASLVLLLLMYVRADVRQARLNRDLNRAVLAGDLAGAQTALERGADPNGWGASTDPDAVFNLPRVRLLLCRISLGMPRPLRRFLHNTHAWPARPLPLPFLISAVSGDRTAVARLLLGRGADPNIRSLLGETPLMIAASASDASCVQSLLDGGANVHATDDRGCTAYDWAAASGKRRRPNLEVLKKAGA